MADVLRPAQWDTNRDSQVSVSLDIGTIPQGWPGGGQYVITIQAHPIRDRRDAQRIADAMREAIGSRLGLLMELQPDGGRVG